MNSLLDIVSGWIIQNPSWTDAIIGAGMILQGELTILLSVYLIINESITWARFLIPGLGALVAAEVLAFYIGRGVRKTRFGWKLSKKWKDNRRVQTYTYYLKTNMTKLFIISKFLPATNLVVLLLVGWSKTKLGTFLKSYITGLATWFIIMMTVAYSLMSGLHYLRSQRVFRQVEIGILAIFIIIFFGEHILRKIFRKYAALQEKIESIGEILGEEKNKTPDK